VSVPELSRRSAMTGAAVAAVAAVAGFTVARDSPAARAKPGTAAANGYGPSIGSGSGSGSGSASGGVRLASVGQVPAGGGIVLDQAGVVLVRTSSGSVLGFSATCTHQGCTVASVQGGKISCPCHGSVFDATTGAVVNGPATRPLPMVAVVVRDGSVFTT
jgi:Rieske Fe-S protein